MNNKELTIEENSNMAMELSEKTAELVVEILKIADKYEQSRDKTMESVIFSLTISTIAGSFDKIKIDEEECDNDCEPVSEASDANE